jgi:membrane-bound lytic murein transglycosylase A
MSGLLCLLWLLAMAGAMDSSARPILERSSFDRLTGWAGADHAGALAAFRRSCVEILAEGNGFKRPVAYGGKREDWTAVCEAARDAGPARKFFEENFIPLAVNDPARPEGLMTGYYEPESEGSLTRGGGYQVPVYGRPLDLVAFDEATADQVGLKYGRHDEGGAKGYFTRAEIEEGALAGRGLELAYLKDWADAFFMQIQGSGRVRLPDGKVIRFAYAAKTGQPYTGIGGVLVERGILPRDGMSMQAVRGWIRANPEAGRALMRENKSFVFFRRITVEDETLGPPGAQKVQLTPLHSLAVDRSLWVFGTPVWLDTTAPSGPDQSPEIFRELMIAQDTGTAIRGHVRGDVFWGAGERAALIAGHMKSPARMVVLLPKPLAKRLLAQ